ncbi:CBN-GES-1 protein [Aphelenchoides avenae]|nr:CBN-GES-1 protein [Aphelenchus avenae]
MAFAESFDRLVGSKFRVVHRDDVVAKLPLRVPLAGASFFHHRYEIWYDNDMGDGAPYRFCERPEDPKCSTGRSGLPLESVHLRYFNTFANINEELIVETSYGRLQGFTVETNAGKKASVFLGIPYAKPPLAELRFEKPRKPNSWKRVRNATSFGAVCFPFHPDDLHRHDGYSEDCLFLNIISPLEKQANAKYPVVVFVHGGGYAHGSSNVHGYKFFAEHYVSKGIVVVTINYRLGFLGFAATGDDAFPGNYGLWDQRGALKYVQQNIHAFGGDPARVTVWGYSAGASSVSALTMSTQTRDLFHQSIEQSGSVFAEWATSNRVIGETEQVANRLKCDLSESQTLKKCLKGKGVHEILDSIGKGKKRWDYNFIKFSPRLDGDFFVKDYPELIEEAPKKPTMAGITNSESLLFSMLRSRGRLKFTVAAMIFRNSTFHSIQIPEDPTAFGREQFDRFVRKVVAPEKLFGSKAKEAQRKVSEFYLKNDNKQATDYRFYVERYLQLFSDLEFIVPTLIEARHKLEAKWPVYLYRTDYFNAKSYPESLPVKGAFHAVEYPYVFGLPFPWAINEFDDNDSKFQRAFIDAIVAFIKTGSPSTDEFKWEKPDESLPLRFASLTPTPSMEDWMYPDRLRFWTDLTKWGGFDSVRGIHATTLRNRDEL